MPTVTKISKQKKIADRYNIFLDESYSFSVTEDILIKYNLRKGLHLSENEIEKITEHESFHRSYIQAIHFLSYRMRSKREIETYLQKKEVAPDVIEEIVNRLEREKHINDLEFANSFVRDRINHSSKGPRLIVNELKDKGVAVEIAKEAVKQYGYDQQVETALKWAEKQMKRKSSHSYNKQIEQLKLKLTQKGYQNDVIHQVITEVTPPLDKQEELAALKKQADKLYNRYKKRYSGYELKMKLKASLYQRGFQGELINEYVADLDD
ncbi:recombination regulator RecX [Pseudogracilibacillus sp. SE30717A]|uniref:recombination regulator RecX n=1 Tax=Pseudogracilibacillus sp. SE30717A TaxID=3098293 RepID=UPI00300E6461